MATKQKEVYRCMVCGNIVEVLHPAVGTLVCCGKDMVLQEERASDEGQEKHVPVIEKTNAGIKVKVGSIAHPMEGGHYIEWIELTVDGISYKKFLKPGEKPEAEFCASGNEISAREYCNMHGLWKA